MDNSTDEAVTKDLIETLEDGREGFTRAADRLTDTTLPQAAALFRELGEQRGRFADELRAVAREYGDEISESGSVAATLHRGWMAIKDAVSGDDPHGVLDAAEQGEDHAVKEYEKALDESGVSPRLHAIIEGQFTQVKAAHDKVKALRDAQ